MRGELLRGIRRDDLEITRIIEGDQRVVCAATGMSAAKYRTHASTRRKLGARLVEVWRGKHEVVDGSWNVGVQNDTPTARHRNCISGFAASKRFAMRATKSFLNSSLSSIEHVAMKSVRLRSSIIG